MTRLARRTLPATADLALLTLLTIPGLPGYLHCAIAVAVVGVLCVPSSSRPRGVAVADQLALTVGHRPIGRRR